MSLADSSKERLHALDGMRGVAALSVMVYHYTLHAHAPLMKSGYIAVDIFFILSGFVLSNRYGDRIKGGMGLAEFMRRRLIRIYPMLFIGSALGSSVFYLYSQAGHSDYSARDIVHAAICNLLTLPYLNSGNVIIAGGHSYSPAFPANDPSWSIFFELAASASFLWLFRAKRSLLLVMMLLCLFSMFIEGIFLSYLTHNISVTTGMGWSSDNFMGGFPRAFYGFACGILLHRCLPLLRARLPLFSPALLYGALLLILAFPFPARGLYYFLGIILLAPALIAAGGVADSGSSRMRSFSHFLGWISYPVYCLHFPVGRLTEMAYAKYPLSVPAPLTAAVATLLLSIALTLIWEQPLRTLLSGRQPAWEAALPKQG